MQKSNGRAMAQGIIGWIDRLGSRLELKTSPSPVQIARHAKGAECTSDSQMSCRVYLPAPPVDAMLMPSI